jgi:hypothetical protein
MRTRDFLILFVSGVAAAGFLLAAGAQLDYINTQREEMKLVINPALENAPPSLAFATVAMGAFRGLIVDILWMRADKLKEEGQFFDARQLAEWITKLQPRFASVWEFHAWNMAYNISVTIPATQPEQRWQWVRNGYELLRDQGIPLNPKSIQLYRELARIFQHKLGGVSDDAHIYYKLQLAEEIGHLLESTDNGLGRNDNRYFEALIEAPKEWAEIHKDPEVAEFVRALQAADENFTTADDFVRAYLSLRQNPQRFKPAAMNVIDAYRGTAVLQRFDLFAKARQLRQEWKLEPAMMHAVSQRHGPVDFADPNNRFPLDWRHPDSHAIYWAVKALDVAIQEQDRDISTHETNTDRIVLHSLQNLFRYGKILIVQGPVESLEGETMMRKDLFLGPDLRIFHAYNNAAMEILEKYADDRGRRESLQNGHRNMLKNAVFMFYQAGLRSEALSIYRRLGQHYPLDEFTVTLEQFARNRFREELESLGIHDAGEQIVALLVNAYYLYAIRDDDGAASNERLAQEVWDHYFASYGVTERIDLPRMPVLRYFAIGQFLGSDAFPPYVRQGLLARIQFEKPELLKQLEQTEGQLRQQMEQLRQTQ